MTEIVFVESGPTDSFSKIPYALRKLGYKTKLVTITECPDSEFIRNSYDQIISFHSRFFHVRLKSFPEILFHFLKKAIPICRALFQVQRLRPNLVIARATPNWMCYLAMKKFTKSSFIYFPYDIRSFTHHNVKDAKKKGVPKFEIEAEKSCFQKADGILHKGLKDELKKLNKAVLGEIEIGCPTLQFLPYCLEELIVPVNNNKISKKIGGTHIVYVGHVATDKAWIENIGKIVKQKIHLHVYGKTANFSKNDGTSHFRKSYEKLVASGYFHIHEPVDQKELAKEISKYDYGFFSFNSEKSFFVATSIGNKFASYLEAGLPIICLDNYQLVTEIIREQKIGFAVKPEKIDSLKNILNNQNIEIFIKNVQKMRRTFTIENRVKDLKEFFRIVEERRLKLSN